MELSSRNGPHAIAVLHGVVKTYIASINLDSQFKAAQYYRDAAREFIRGLCGRNEQAREGRVVRLTSAFIDFRFLNEP